MFKLVRDEIPELIKKQGQVCNFAQIQNPELMIGFLREKLIEEVNEFLSSDPASTQSLEELVDVLTVVRAICSFGGIDNDTLEKLYSDKMAKKGGFVKGYIMYIPDPIEQGQVTTHE